jgi:gamma-glutamyltranspeptidase/glutathione hydrolase
MKKYYSLLLIVGQLFFLTCHHKVPVPTKNSTGSKGMVVTSHPLASEAGLAILKQGGNAADAAIAVQFALAVVYPRAGNIGGGGFMIYRDSTGEMHSLDFREIAPKAASRDMFLDSAGNVIQGSSLNGILAAGVPGSVAGMFEAHAKFGSLPWPDLIAPAIKLARKGFRISGKEAKKLNETLALIRQYSPYPNPFTRKDEWKDGDLIKQPELAKTLEKIAREGAMGFYEGDNATLIDSVSRLYHGLITRDDLRDYKPVWRKPLKLQWRDCDLYTMGLPSSGGILIGQMLGMMEGKIQDSLGPSNIQNIQLLVEAARRAFADRATYLGDAEFFEVPVDSLLSAHYLKEKFSDYTPTMATPSDKIKVDRKNFSREKFETTHFSIADGHGNAAAVTTTLNDNFGCKVWIPGGGYFLNSEMDDFSVKPGEPNLFGLIGAEANAIYPGKKPLSSMTPIIIEKNGKLHLIMGSRGGSTIMTTLLQILLDVEAYHMTLEEAVNTKRYHHQWLPDEISYERNAFSKSLEDSLATMGYKLHPIEAIGSVEAIWLDENGLLHGVADPKLDDQASGW